MVLDAAEKAHQKGIKRAAEFLNSKSEEDLDSLPDAFGLVFGRYRLTVFAEFARMFGGRLFRDNAIRMTQSTSGLPQEIVRNLWGHDVPESVKISRGRRGPGRKQRSLELEPGGLWLQFDGRRLPAERLNRSD